MIRFSKRGFQFQNKFRKHNNLPDIVDFQCDTIPFTVPHKRPVLPIDDQFERFVELWVNCLLLCCRVSGLWWFFRWVREFVCYVCVHVLGRPT